MKKGEIIVESVSVISEEELLVQELDKRLSFDVFVGGLPCHEKHHCPEFGCKCITKDWCTVDAPAPTPACGVRG